MIKILYKKCNKSVILYSILIPVILTLFGLNAFSQQDNTTVSVESGINKSRVTVGELVLYEIVIRFSPELIVTAPPPGINLGGFEIRDYEDLDPQEVDGLIEKRVKFIIAAYDTGTYAIPPTGIVVMMPDSTREVLLTDEVTIRVESVLTGDAEDILDLKTPFDIPKSWTLIIIAGACILAALAAGGWIYYWRKKKKGEGLFDFRKEPDRPAHEIALESLEQLRQSGLLSDGKIKEYYIELSEIVRLYLQRRYFIPALEMTTYEAVNALAETMIEEEPLAVTTDLLEICDMVKFAKFRPGDETHEFSWKQALDIVEKTKVDFTPPAGSFQLSAVSGQQSAIS